MPVFSILFVVAYEYQFRYNNKYNEAGKTIMSSETYEDDCSCKSKSAIITTSKRILCVWLYWDWDFDIVEPLLLFCKVQGARSPSIDDSGWGRIAQHFNNMAGCGNRGAVIGLYGKTSDTYGMDNGVYVAGDDWAILEHIGGPDNTKKATLDDVMDIIRGLDSSLPSDQHLPLRHYRNAAKGRFPDKSYEQIARFRTYNSFFRERMDSDIDRLFEPAGSHGRRRKD